MTARKDDWLSVASALSRICTFQNAYSDNCKIKYGVPQGSVLGPLLFLLYINDITNASNLGHFILFADDTNIFVTGKSEVEVYSHANQVLRAVYDYMVSNLLHINISKSVYMLFNSLIILLDTLRNLLAFADDLAIILSGFCLNTLRDLGQHYITACNKWCEANGLKLSAIKTQVIIFSRKYKICLPPKIKLKGLDIDFCNTVKYLGIHLDSRLNWHEHVHQTAKKCTNILFATRKMIGDRWGLSPDKICWVFNAIIKPIMTYACVTWAPRLLENKSLMTQLDRAGNLTLLMTSGARRSSSQEVLHTLFSLLPASLELEKTSLLQAIRLKSLDHWPNPQIDHTKRKSLEPCFSIIDRILNKIFANFDHHENDLTKPTDISQKNYTLKINDIDMVPLDPTNYTITTYTDGSKHKDDSTGYGVVIFMNSATLMTENFTLDHHHTVFQCEAHALHRASILLNDILSSPSLSEHRVIIYSDSQALIKALSNSYSISKTIINLHKSLNETASTHSIMIEWVPGHKDHYGNELADKLANIRMVKPNPALSTNHPSIPHTFFKNKVHNYINDKKMKLWNNSNISQNTKSLVSACITCINLCSFSVS